jgi:hypothetical protein
MESGNSIDDLSASARQALNRNRISVADEQIKCGTELVSRNIQFRELGHFCSTVSVCTLSRVAAITS